MRKPISFQERSEDFSVGVDSFIKDVRNESKRRRELSGKEPNHNENDYEQEFQKLGLISDKDKTELKMKRKVVRTLIRE